MVPLLAVQEALHRRGKLGYVGVVRSMRGALDDDDLGVRQALGEALRAQREWGSGKGWTGSWISAARSISASKIRSS